MSIDRSKGKSRGTSCGCGKENKSGAMMKSPGQRGQENRSHKSHRSQQSDSTKGNRSQQSSRGHKSQKSHKSHVSPGNRSRSMQAAQEYWCLCGPNNHKDCGNSSNDNG